MMRHGNSIFNIGGSIPCLFDLDASKVIEAVRSTGVTITPAMMHYAHYLISNAKNIGTWQLSNAIYGFLGGTSASHKWNWKNLQDANAAFRLQFFNSPIHNNLGMKLNGSTQYAETFLASNLLTANNIHLSVYLTTLQTNNGSYLRAGAATNTTLQFDASVLASSTNGVALPTPSDKSKGYYLAFRNSISNHFFYKNGGARPVALSTNAAAALTADNFSIGKAAAGSFSDAGFGFTSIGAGFTELQAQQQSQIVTNAQNILNRS